MPQRAGTRGAARFISHWESWSSSPSPLFPRSPSASGRQLELFATDREASAVPGPVRDHLKAMQLLEDGGRGRSPDDFLSCGPPSIVLDDVTIRHPTALHPAVAGLLNGSLPGTMRGPRRPFRGRQVNPPACADGRHQAGERTDSRPRIRAMSAQRARPVPGLASSGPPRPSEPEPVALPLGPDRDDPPRHRQTTPARKADRPVRSRLDPRGMRSRELPPRR